VNMGEFMDEKLEQAAREYEKLAGGDCLNEKTVPGTPVGECLYFFCGCSVYEAFKAGAKWQVEQDRIHIEKLEAEILAINHEAGHKILKLREALEDIRWSWENDAGRQCDNIAADALKEYEYLK